MPEFGGYIPTKTGIDNAYTLGLTSGFRWFKYFATELEYQRVLERGNQPAANIIDAVAVVRFPFDKIVH